MTFKTQCLCGNEFYLSVNIENGLAFQFCKDRFEEWREIHANCSHEIHEIDIEDLLKEKDWEL